MTLSRTKLISKWALTAFLASGLISTGLSANEQANAHASIHAQLAKKKQSELTAKEIMILNEASRKSVTEYSTLQMKLTNAKGQERNRVLELRIDDSNIIARKTYVEFVEPSSIKGTRILTLEKESAEEDADRWIFLPALRKTRRIAASDIGESFVGTEFTYEDMEIADGVVGSANHSYKILREEEATDALGVVKPTWVIEALPVTQKRIEESSYSKRIIWVEKDYFTAIKEEYYDKKGEHMKTRTSADVTKFYGQNNKEVWRPNRIEMIDHMTHNKTLIIFDQQIDKPISDRVFTKRFLKTGL
ncbi:outer membrane lipoprotein-sorting protein [Pseudoalteromonas byunsanensis]|uniref:Uncharacterized protein TP-0789 domain-containing protein n=1 Tax=Pseudoalteromonas byunsanensis TaxID=327939 RepID=A0A1S1N4H1_9GAMM|nr:outer membrane lipoprotein-sorting protein [Pseudoalteromonas byunsanensis]OHU96005.1 hypothetical protein BIW53_09395 [Pseudoalteromonas byunsanensis]